MTGKDRHSPATRDLQKIVDATHVQMKAQPKRFEHMVTDTPPVQRVPRVHTTASMPIPHTDANRMIKHSMNMMTPFPKVPINSALTNKTTTPPINSMRQECIWKRCAARLQSAEPTINTSPCIWTQVQVATVAARVAPSALSTHSHA
jgi:hypothetical protein